MIYLDIRVHDQGKTTKFLIRSQNLLRWMEPRTTKSVLAQVSYLLDYRLARRKSNIYQKREGDPDDEPSCERTESIITSRIPTSIRISRQPKQLLRISLLKSPRRFGCIAPLQFNSKQVTVKNSLLDCFAPWTIRARAV
jgi:hypothetical protein